MRKDAPGQARGFSLVELSITLAVLAILAGLAMPSLQDLVRGQRTAATLSLLASQLAQARMAAISRGTPVTVCPSLGDGRCRADPDWSAGWLVYHDPPRAAQPRSADDILQDIRGPVPSSVTVRSTGGRIRLRYHPDGMSSGTNLTLQVCQDALVLGEVVVNNAGRVRTRRLQTPYPCAPA